MRMTHLHTPQTKGDYMMMMKKIVLILNSTLSRDTYFNIQNIYIIALLMPKTTIMKQQQRASKNISLHSARAWSDWVKQAIWLAERRRPANE